METTMTLKMSETGEDRALQPMGWIESILVVLVPALAMLLAHYVAFPYLKSNGLPPYQSYCYSVIPVVAGMLIAALVGYHWEGRPWTWTAFSQRFRLARMSKRAWLWTGLAIIAYLVIAQAVNSLLLLLYQTLNFTMPTSFVFGAPSPLLALVMVFFNIIGEEFWWRGYILPRQELRFGRWAWLVNGTLWAFFHLFRWWSLPGMLIFCQIIPFISQRVKNNWPAIILHFLSNGLGIVVAVIMQIG